MRTSRIAASLFFIGILAADVLMLKYNWLFGLPAHRTHQAKTIALVITVLSAILLVKQWMAWRNKE
jgi:hypothetical protein